MIEFTAYCPARHLGQIIELEKELWSEKTSSEIRKIFEWKYPENTNLVNGFVALDGDKVVGFRGFFIQDYVHNGNIFPISVLGDAVVHPDYQRRGIFSNLTKKALEYYATSPMKYILGLSSNTKSSPGNLKLGWVPFLRKEYRISISLRNIILGFLKKKKSKVIIDGYEIETIGLPNINRIARELDTFCQSIDGKDGISLRRDSHYWTWRFARPDWQTSFAVLRKKGKINGVVALLSEKRKGINTIQILDVVVKNSSLFPILFKGVRKMTNAWCYFILATSGVSDTVLCSCFPFIRRSKTDTPADFYLIKSLINNDNNKASLCGDKKIVINYSNID